MSLLNHIPWNVRPNELVDDLYEEVRYRTVVGNIPKKEEVRELVQDAMQIAAHFAREQAFKEAIEALEQAECGKYAIRTVERVWHRKKRRKHVSKTDTSSPPSQGDSEHSLETGWTADSAGEAATPAA